MRAPADRPHLNLFESHSIVADHSRDQTGPAAHKLAHVTIHPVLPLLFELPLNRAADPQHAWILTAIATATDVLVLFLVLFRVHGEVLLVVIVTTVVGVANGMLRQQTTTVQEKPNAIKRIRLYCNRTGQRFTLNSEISHQLVQISLMLDAPFHASHGAKNAFERLIVGNAINNGHSRGQHVHGSRLGGNNSFPFPS